MSLTHILVTCFLVITRQTQLFLLHQWRSDDDHDDKIRRQTTVETLMRKEKKAEISHISTCYFMWEKLWLHARKVGGKEKGRLMQLSLWTDGITETNSKGDTSWCCFCLTKGNDIADCCSNCDDDTLCPSCLSLWMNAHIIVVASVSWDCSSVEDTKYALSVMKTTFSLEQRRRNTNECK